MRSDRYIATVFPFDASDRSLLTIDMNKHRLANIRVREPSEFQQETVLVGKQTHVRDRRLRTSTERAAERLFARGLIVDEDPMKIFAEYRQRSMVNGETNGNETRFRIERHESISFDNKGEDLVSELRLCMGDDLMCSGIDGPQTRVVGEILRDGRNQWNGFMFEEAFVREEEERAMIQSFQRWNTSMHMQEHESVEDGEGENGQTSRSLWKQSHCSNVMRRMMGHW